MPQPTNTSGESFRVTRQLQIYRAGPQTGPSAIPLAPEDLERKAQAKLSPEAFDWVAGGAGRETTLRNNLQAFDRWEIVPRMLRDIAQREWSVELFGRRHAWPVMLAPIGVQAAVHPDGELATARAAAAMNVGMILSTVSSHPMEAVAGAVGDGIHWYQLYWPNVPELAESLIHRAENAGYSAIVVTLDTPTLGWRERNLGLAYLPFLRGEGLGNYLSDPVFRDLVGGEPRDNIEKSVETYLRVFSDLRRTWQDLAWVKSHTKLPVLVKGVQCADDARRALDAGVDGICVSNHGGRQVDGAVGTLTVLPEIVDAVADRVAVLLDSGIRRGCDVMKALALGAKMILVGRPYMYALAINGETGIREFLSNFLADVDLTMALCGKCRVGDVGRGDLKPGVA